MKEVRPAKQQRTTERTAHLPLQRIAVILCGLPGAGKSTFASNLIASSNQQWVRVNQDTIARGRRGTREQCVHATREHLQAGRHVIIDRTNLDSQQRKVFIDVAKECGLSPAHILCVFFDFPQKFCGAQAAGRKAHEGGLQGPRSYATIGSMAKQLRQNGHPHHVKEGIGAVIVCKSDEEAARALTRVIEYAESGSTHPSLSDEVSEIKDRPMNIANTQPGEKNAFDILMASSTSKRLIDSYEERKQNENRKAASHTNFRSRHTFPSSPFASAFDRYVQLIPRHLHRLPDANNVVLNQDNLCLLVLDKYPKARHHALVIARDDELQGPLDLRCKDVSLVQHMKKVGLGWAAVQQGSTSWAIGFHAVPSIRRLHLHVISKVCPSVFFFFFFPFVCVFVFVSPAFTTLPLHSAGLRFAMSENQKALDIIHISRIFPRRGPNLGTNGDGRDARQ